MTTTLIVHRQCDTCGRLSKPVDIRQPEPDGWVKKGEQDFCPACVGALAMSRDSAPPHIAVAALTSQVEARVMHPVEVRDIRVSGELVGVNIYADGVLLYGEEGSEPATELRLRVLRRLLQHLEVEEG